MTYDAFITELNRAGLTVRRFATLMCMQPNSISNNKKKGEVPAHLAVIASLLSEMALNDLDFHPVFARLGPNPKKARGASKTGKFARERQGVLELGK